MRNFKVFRAGVLAALIMVVTMVATLPAAERGRSTRRTTRPARRTTRPAKQREAAPKTAVAGDTQSQSMRFGGGECFEFTIPVSAAGQVEVQADWSPKISAEAQLFSSDPDKPAATAQGQGSLALEYSVPAAAGKDWLLTIVMKQDAPDVSGTVSVSWPGQKGSKLIWSNADAPDPQTKLLLDKRMEKINRLLAGGRATNESEEKFKNAIATDARFRESLSRMNKVYRARTAAIDAAPRGSVQLAVQRLPKAQPAQQTRASQTISTEQLQRKTQDTERSDVSTIVRPELTAGATVNVRFLRMSCYEIERRKHMFYLVGIVDDPFSDSETTEREVATVGHTDIFLRVESGDTRPESGIDDKSIFRRRVTGRSFLFIVSHSRYVSTSRHHVDTTPTEAQADIYAERFLACLKCAYLNFPTRPGQTSISLGDMQNEVYLLFNSFMPQYHPTYMLYGKTIEITPEGVCVPGDGIWTWSKDTQYGKGYVHSVRDTTTVAKPDGSLLYKRDFRVMFRLCNSAIVGGCD